MAMQPAGIEINGITVFRSGRTTGRWAKYDLIVNGVNLGTVQRTLSHGSDRLARSQLLGDGWRIHGVVCHSQASAEATLIERAKRFGTI